MPSLQIRELPEHIYQALCRRAREEHRSITKQAVSALARGLDVDLEASSRRVRLLQAIKEENSAQPTGPLPAPARLIREDRDR
jgi:plasmid stability protein